MEAHPCLRQSQATSFHTNIVLPSSSNSLFIICLSICGANKKTEIVKCSLATCRTRADIQLIVNTQLPVRVQGTRTPLHSRVQLANQVNVDVLCAIDYPLVFFCSVTCICLTNVLKFANLSNFHHLIWPASPRSHTLPNCPDRPGTRVPNQSIGLSSTRCALTTDDPALWQYSPIPDLPEVAHPDEVPASLLCTVRRAHM